MEFLPRVSKLVFLPLVGTLEPLEERESERRDLDFPRWLLTDFLDFVDFTDLTDGLLLKGVFRLFLTPLVSRC